MRSKTITELTESTSPANDDLLVIYDVAGEETKKVKVQNLPKAAMTIIETADPVDDSNQIFGFDQEPKLLNINGAMYPKATEDKNYGPYAWTWNSGTSQATLAVPVGSGGFIHGLV